MPSLLSDTSLTSLHRGLTASFTRRLAAGLIAAPLVLGAVSVTALVCAIPAGAIATFHPVGSGGWQGFIPDEDGEALAGVLTKMSKGGVFLFGINSHTRTLKLTDPKWDYKVGDHPRVCVKIDGVCFAGRAIVTSPDVIEIPDVSKDLLDGFFDGREAIVDIDDGTIMWTLNLDGFTAAMRDVARYYKASF